ncbi:holin [Clostridium amazonitimonense]|uniref:holin n=1 Tax=Clostridium amazonitimonense TaxID=1499689 RepID=UPI000509E272|nr:holin [Clostridium amazonitimonense]
MKLKRLRNYGLWISIFAFIPLLLKGFNINILPQNYEEIVSSLLAILVMAGLISNPATENKWYLDDEINKEQDKIEKEQKDFEEEKKE